MEQDISLFEVVLYYRNKEVDINRVCKCQQVREFEMLIDFCVINVMFVFRRRICEVRGEGKGNVGINIKYRVLYFEDK